MRSEIGRSRNWTNAGFVRFRDLRFQISKFLCPHKFPKPLFRRFERFLTLLPVRGANLAVFLCVVNRVKQSKDFIDISAEIEMIDGGVLEDSVLVDDEESAQRNT